ncbi:hypothetical protein BC831DRAFT_547872 [Entophlyctis helioformis]|nr:hypothetical protein BC831DRAFT_547872 [Entophlyctis helioformis]
MPRRQHDGHEPFPASIPPSPHHRQHRRPPPTTPAMPSHRPAASVVLALALLAACARIVVAADWVLLTRITTCTDTPVPTSEIEPAALVVPATLPPEPLRCLQLSAASSAFAQYADASKRTVAFHRCTSADCAASTCAIAATPAVAWQPASANIAASQGCGPVFVPVSSTAVLTIDDMDRAMQTAGVAGKTGAGAGASSYYRELVYAPPSAACAGDPTMGIVRYVFSSCTRANTTHYVTTSFNINGLPDITTLACTDASCTNCVALETAAKPAAPGGRPVCTAQPSLGGSALVFDAVPLTNGSASGSTAADGSAKKTPDAVPSTATISPAVFIGVSSGFVVALVAVGFVVAKSRRSRARHTGASKSRRSQTSQPQPRPSMGSGTLSRLISTFRKAHAPTAQAASVPLEVPVIVITDPMGETVVDAVDTLARQQTSNPDAMVPKPSRRSDDVESLH